MLRLPSARLNNNANLLKYQFVATETVNTRHSREKMFHNWRSRLLKLLASFLAAAFCGLVIYSLSHLYSSHEVFFWLATVTAVGWFCAVVFAFFVTDDAGQQVRVWAIGGPMVIFFSVGLNFAATALPTTKSFAQPSLESPNS